MNQPLPSNEAKQAHPWLLKHYEEKRQRTIHLVQAAVDQLVKEEQTVTIEAICRKSAELDTAGRGVKKSAILENQQAHAYYRQHSQSYQRVQGRKRHASRSHPKPHVPLQVDLQRDVNRVRQRYLKHNKAELVERLVMVEQAYAESQQQLARLQFKLLDLQQMMEQKQQERPHHSS